MLVEEVIPTPPEFERIFLAETKNRFHILAKTNRNQTQIAQTNSKSLTTPPPLKLFKINDTQVQLMDEKDNFYL